MQVIYTKFELTDVQLKYLKWYHSIIRRAYYRDKFSEYGENHHILPESIENTEAVKILLMTDIDVKIGMKVRLTYSEHYVVHTLLVKIFKYLDKNCYYKMLKAHERMTGATAKQKNGENKSKEKYTNKDYALFKEEKRRTMSEQMKGRVPWNKGISPSIETRKKQSKKLKGEKSPNFGKISIYNEKLDIVKFILPEQLEQYIKEGWRKGGRPVSEITKAKISKILEGNTRNLGKKLSSTSIAKREATKIKNGTTNKGENNGNYGKSPSDATKQLLREKNLGENNPNYGKHPTPETIAKKKQYKPSAESLEQGIATKMRNGTTGKGKKKSATMIAKSVMTKKKNRERRILEFLSLDSSKL